MLGVGLQLTVRGKSDLVQAIRESTPQNVSRRRPAHLAQSEHPADDHRHSRSASDAAATCRTLCRSIRTRGIHRRTHSRHVGQLPRQRQGIFPVTKQNMRRMLTAKEHRDEPNRTAAELNALPIEPISVRIATAVKLTGIPRTTLYELIKSGEIETVKIGRPTCIPHRCLRRVVGVDCLRASDYMAVL